MSCGFENTPWQSVHLARWPRQGIEMFPEPHPDGEQLLTKLIKFITASEHDILSGRLTLRLSPRAVEYIAGRLASLDELRGLK
eukprot:scaffold658249_cov43-Prasinocladus_malaysianus.AAC.1